MKKKVGKINIDGLGLKTVVGMGLVKAEYKYVEGGQAIETLAIKMNEVIDEMNDETLETYEDVEENKNEVNTDYPYYGCEDECSLKQTSDPECVDKASENDAKANVIHVEVKELTENTVETDHSKGKIAKGSIADENRKLKKELEIYKAIIRDVAVVDNIQKIKTENIILIFGDRDVSQGIVIKRKDK